MSAPSIVELTPLNFVASGIRHYIRCCPHKCPHTTSTVGYQEFTFPVAPGNLLNLQNYEIDHLSKERDEAYHTHCDANCDVYIPPGAPRKEPQVINQVPFYTAVRGFLFWGRKAADPNETVLSQWWYLVKNAVLPGPWKAFINAIDGKTPLPPRSPFIDGSLGVYCTSDWFEQRWRKQYPDLWCPGHPGNLYLFDPAAALDVVPRIAESHLHLHPPTRIAPHQQPSQIPKIPEPGVEASAVPTTCAEKRQLVSTSDDEESYGYNSTELGGSAALQSRAPPRMMRKRATIKRPSHRPTLDMLTDQDKDDVEDIEAAPKVGNGIRISQAMTDEEGERQPQLKATMIADESLVTDDDPLFTDDDQEEDEVSGLLFED
ncbi:hypothetical protein V5O48_006337 [Marasmius crinis-equi]|uniref:Uncharacterized protein n=1 Tax=Marasmius crinis-equi TaxID=585013 RepID=A0ABR3FJS8_9AGAR